MRQIAVLPYRFGGPAQDGPTEILLITSRETKRWVVPKGNPLNGMPRHAAAAVEAEAEAGLIGAVCPPPLAPSGSTHRRRDGPSHMYYAQSCHPHVTTWISRWQKLDDHHN